MKKCKNCNKLKNLDEFYTHKTNKDNLQNVCIDCKKKDQKRRYAKRKEQKIKGVIEEGKKLKEIKIKETDAYEYLLKIIDKYDLKNKSRKNKYVYRRGAFYRYLRIMSNGELTLQFCAELIGTDHSNVHNSLKTIQSLIDSKDQLYYHAVYQLELDLRGCPPIEIKKPNTQNNLKDVKNPFLEVINRIFEARDMADVEALKAYINENINPNKL